MEDKFNTRYQKLNEEQRRAVDCVDGPVLVLAGPGSGKTELLSMRVANILLKTDALPSSILCLTFTDAAAHNMRERLEAIIGAAAYQVAIHTFHSFGQEILSTNPDLFTHGLDYTTADELAKAQILEEVFESLPFENELAKHSHEHGFTYSRQAGQHISNLKKEGITPGKFREIIEGNKSFFDHIAPAIANFCAQTAGARKLDKISGPAIELSAAIASAPPSNIKDLYLETFTLALEEAENINKTNPVTAWRDKFTEKDAQKVSILKAAKNHGKMLALADIYSLYQQKLAEKLYFDFDDLLIKMVNQIAETPELGYRLQEKYQYVLVDEFQDTNALQMKMVDLILDTEINEGRPNILAVGDDDQAIFKFQGAQVSNIKAFYEKYRDPQLIVLTKNYRSNKAIVSAVRKVILTGENRLENTIEELSKELESANPSIPDGKMELKIFQKEEQELIWIAEDIRKQKEAGKLNYSEIAVISRQHQNLQKIAAIFSEMGIPVSYDQSSNALEEPHVKMLLTMLTYIASINRKGREVADYLLPEILSYDFWQIPKLEIWKISRSAYHYQKPKLWLDQMLESQSPLLKDIAQFFIELAELSKTHTIEEVIDYLIGNRDIVFASDLFESRTIFSPYKEFYFGPKAMKKNQKQYLEMLTSLTAFVKKVKSFHAKKIVSLDDALETLKLYTKYKLRINASTNFNLNDSVNLLTAHKSKGLEFSHVYLVNCEDKTWFKKGPPANISLPPNLPLGAESDNIDDVLRLFYVALSRAKSSLTLTFTEITSDKKDKKNEKLRFITEDLGITSELIPLQEDDLKTFELEFLAERKTTLDEFEHNFLKGIVANYTLSPTGLIAFLNLKQGGPQNFLREQLIKFPQQKNVHSSYGTAMHAALEEFLRAYRKSQTPPSLNNLKEYFRIALDKTGMNERDLYQYGEKGNQQLELFYENHLNRLDPTDLPEVSFSGENVVINNAKISGKIDRFKIHPNNEISVIDYKTGKVLTKWESDNEDDQLRAWKYKLQMTCYKLLVENSRNYRQYTVRQGAFEFLDAKKPNQTILNCPIDPQDEEETRLLIGKVYAKIVNLDFPDTSSYSEDINGIKAFILDLINDRI